MVALPKTFNTADLPDTAGITLIPEGPYKAVIVFSEMKNTSSGTGQYLELKFVITEGPYMNTEMYERLNIVNQNQAAVEIAYKTLARISEALGMSQTPSDSMQLHNKPLMIDVKTEKGKEYTDKDGVKKEGKDKSIIAKYHAIPGVGVASNPSFSQAQAAPAAAQPPVVAPWAK